MRHLDLFSGIGGFALAARWANIETVGFCEIDSYCQKVLKKHWPDTPIIEDIRSLKNEGQFETIDIITGGFPCQPFSVAGKKRGTKDNRDLWPEMFRVIKEFKPTWVIGENVANFTNMAFKRTKIDLESEGYEVQPLIIPACALNAPHQRNRIWILAYSEQSRAGDKSGSFRVQERKLSESRGAFIRQKDGKVGTDRINTTSSNVLVYPNSIGGTTRDKPNIEANETRQEQNRDGSSDSDQLGCSSKNVANSQTIYVQRQSSKQRKRKPWGGSWWSTEPDVGRVADGVPSRVDRLKGLGNAIVPQVAYEIMKEIKEGEG